MTRAKPPRGATSDNQQQEKKADQGEKRHDCPRVQPAGPTHANTRAHLLRTKRALAARLPAWDTTRTMHPRPPFTPTHALAQAIAHARVSVLTVTLLALALALGVSTGALAQYPARSIKLLVPAGPGDGTDVVARLLGKPLAEALGQPVVIDNRPGAGGSIAGAQLASASPDGYTLMLVNGSSHGVTPGLYPNLPYDSVRDISPIALLAISPNVLVINPANPATTLADFLAWARSHPGKADIASAGNGSLSHLSVEMFRRQAQIDAVNIGYKAAAPALTDLMAGQVSAMIINIPSTLALVKSGRLRALATTGARRTPFLPDVPTLAEAGLSGYETLAWFGLAAPARTPGAIVGRINAEVLRALARADVREQLATMGAEPAAGTPEAFTVFIQAEISKYSRVIRESGIRVE